MERITAEMAKAYRHLDVEERIYDFWLRSGYFTPQIDPQRKPFTISMPPPNVTGELHHGHAMFLSFQDLIIRWRRMQGYAALWLPGTDHAGIATQNVVEEELAKEGQTRYDLGREGFEQRVWAWKEKYGAIITHQIRRMGASCDWTRERFTLDEGLSRAVRTAFVQLFEKGLIYRGKYMINWCPRCSTAISDLEVEHRQVASTLVYVRYPLVAPNSDEVSPGEYITVATTRPETILGDTAVAVNPSDSRFRSLVGRHAKLPAVGRIIPIIADPVVDPEFGTGAVKVTPAHDPVDYEIGQRHGLAAVNVMNLDATMNEAAGPYQGLDRYQCRAALLRDLEAHGLLVKVEDYQHALGHCHRCDTVIEPTISEQWFVRVKPLAEVAMATVRDGRIRVVPERFTRVYFNWMENIRDWCISRQLWWGHRIPVWYCQRCGHTIAAIQTPTSCPKCQSHALEQDPDVLDTWFSSALWPFSTLGWPERTPDLSYFYPTSLMETGYDIIFFWVARMIMMGLECTGEVPFRTVYFHGLMRDEQGEKMSKSKGNVANPLTVIEAYGADALRFTIITGSSPGNDMKLSEEKLQGARNFANKLWNAARFVHRALLAIGHVPGPDASSLALEDRWILSRASWTVSEVTRLMEQYQFGEAGRVLHDFVWGEFCDWYIEMAKLRLYSGEQGEEGGYLRSLEAQTALGVLVQVTDTVICLLHPFMPFVTEEIWQHLKAADGTSTGQGMVSLATQPWPVPGLRDETAETAVPLLIETIRAIRNARAEHSVEPARQIEALVVTGNWTPLFREKEAIVARLARVRLSGVEEKMGQHPSHALVLMVGPVEVYLPLAGMFDLDRERQRLEQEAQALTQEITRIEQHLADKAFTNRAPPPIVERERVRLEARRQTLAKVQERLALLAS